jgi:hypothetical protein
LHFLGLALLVVLLRGLLLGWMAAAEKEIVGGDI